jgi:hypothetical protein
VASGKTPSSTVLKPESDDEELDHSEIATLSSKWMLLRPETRPRLAIFTIGLRNIAAFVRFPAGALSDLVGVPCRPLFRKAAAGTAARLVSRRVPELSTFPPEILLPGARGATVHDVLYNAFSFGLFAAYELYSEDRQLLDRLLDAWREPHRRPNDARLIGKSDDELLDELFDTQTSRA